MGVLLSVAGGSDLGLFEINEACELVQAAAHPNAKIIFGTTIDDALGDEVRITVIAAGFDGGLPKMRKSDRKPFAEPVIGDTVANSGLGAATVAAGATAVSSNSWFGDSAIPATETIDIDVVTTLYAEPASQSETPAAFRNNGDGAQPGEQPANSKYQSADGTWGDDLDIPEFLR
jgi:cell division protein FtsZ